MSDLGKFFRRLHNLFKNYKNTKCYLYRAMMVVQDAYTDFWPVAHMAGGHICLCHVATTMLGIFVDCVFCGSEVAIKGRAMCEWSD